LKTGFDIDEKKCTECMRCTSVCSLVKTGKVLPEIGRIQIVKNWPAYPEISVCRFDDCSGQPCIEVCPVDAISNRDGIVLIDDEACIRCGVCVDACPYNAIRLDKEGLAYKCDFCGGEPACVPECVTFAIKTTAGE
jgi:anaerobic carbon-monoxide dehydrogenase iron sulfur subunit